MGCVTTATTRLEHRIFELIRGPCHVAEVGIGIKTPPWLPHPPDDMSHVTHSMIKTTTWLPRPPHSTTHPTTLQTVHRRVRATKSKGLLHLLLSFSLLPAPQLPFTSQGSGHGFLSQLKCPGPVPDVPLA